MAFKVQVGPAQIAIHQGRTVLVCDPDATMPSPSEKGLYTNDTRIISSWSLSEVFDVRPNPAFSYSHAPQ